MLVLSYPGKIRVRGDLAMQTNKTSTEASQSEQKYNPAIDISIGRHEFIIGKRYGFIYTLNDILIAVWFIIGSVLFFWNVTETAGTWLFLIGSLELLIRPLIRIARNSHLKRIGNKING